MIERSKRIKFVSMKMILKESNREKFLVVMHDIKNQYNTIDICSIGLLNAPILYSREVFKSAIMSNVYSILLVYNHSYANEMKIEQLLVD